MEILILVAIGLYLAVTRAPATASASAAPAAVNALGTGAAGVAVGDISFPPIGPNSDPRTWFQGITPGTVTVAGQTVQSNYSPNAKSSAVTGLSLAGTGISAAMGVAGSVATFGGTTSILATSTILGAATMGIGIVVGIAATIIGMIHAHHAAALAAEGKALNDADYRMVNAMVLVMQGVVNGEIASIAAAQGMLNQIVTDWYGEVKPVQRGTWHYTGQDMTADYQKVWIERTQPPKGAPGYSDYHAPDPCNGACVIGHFYAERNPFLVMAAVKDALAGNHGQLVIPEITAYESQLGTPEVVVTY